MECPTCRNAYQPGDRFCGTCGERLPSASAAQAAGRGPQSAPAATIAERLSNEASAANPPPPSARGLFSSTVGSRTAACPTCAAPLIPGQTKCQVCGMALDAMNMPDTGAAPASTPRPPTSMFNPAMLAGGDQTIALPSGIGAMASAPPSPTPPVPPSAMTPPVAPPTPPSPRPEARPAAGTAICPIHGEMDPTWTRCPHCLKEGRDGRLSTPPGGLPRPLDVAMREPPPSTTPSTVVAPSSSVTAPSPVVMASPAAPPPAAAAPPPVAAAPPPAPAPYVPPAAAPAPAAPAPAYYAADPVPPSSSVGRTVVVRRGPRLLAYLIEKEGKQVGRPFQLEDDVTDIGRDPRNHLVVGDPMVSGFHARMEKNPDGTFTLQDRGSSNGTRVNGHPVTDRVRIQENDEISLGNTTLVLKVVQ